MTTSKTPANSAPPTRLRLAVLCPHFEPDTAPTGAVMTRIVHELAALGHEIHVITALPWYRSHQVEAGWSGRWIRREQVEWGSIIRVHPFPGDDKSNLLRRAFGFVGFSALAGFAGVRGGRVDAVLAMSPPLTNGLLGWMIKVVRRGPLVFNIQDVFPDAAIETGAITNRRIIGVARWLERVSYRRSDAVTVLSNDLRDNVVAKVGSQADKVRVIPNFVLTEEIRPLDRMTNYRRELGIGNGPVVLYAGNVGFSQSLDLMIAAAEAVPSVTFLINGEGSARAAIEIAAAALPNVVMGRFQPAERLAEVLATGDIHVVALRSGLARVSVPSKTYSIMAAGRPLLAAIDPGTEVPRIVSAADAGMCVDPDRADLFIAALREMLADPERLVEMGANGRRWVLGAASPAAVAKTYAELFVELSRHNRSGFRSAR